MEEPKLVGFKESWEKNVASLFRVDASEADLASDVMPTAPQFGIGIVLTIFYMLIIPAVLVAVVFLIKGTDLSDTEMAFFEVLIQVGTGVILIATAAVLIPIRQVFPSLGNFKVTPRIIVLQTVAMVFLGGLLNILLMSLGVEGNAENQDIVTQMVISYPLLMGIAVVILAPIVEELLFRYYLFGFISKHSRWIAYLVSSSLFGFIHVMSDLANNWMFILPYAGMGLVLAWSYDSSKRIIYPILVHAANNGLSFILMILALLIN